MIRIAFILMCFCLFHVDFTYAQTEVTVNRISRLSASSESVVVGIVDTTYSEWNDDNSRIYTYTNIQISVIIHGNKVPPVVRIITYGGRVGNVIQRTTYNDARFRKNEKVLVFLQNCNNDYRNCFVVDGTEGKYNIIADQDGKEIVICEAGVARETAASGRSLQYDVAINVIQQSVIR